MRLPAGLVRAALVATVRPVLGPRVPVRLQRAYLDAASAAFVVPRGTSVTRTVLGGRPADRVRAPGADRDGAVLLVHGGAFLTMSPRSHRAFAAHLSAATGRPVSVVDYRLAPEHPYPAAVDDAEAAFGELAAHGPVTLVGDSAGGTIALLLALRLRDAGGPTADALGLVSPVADLTLARSAGYRGPDAVLQQGWLAQGVALWLAGADPAAVSPLAADLSGLPRTVVHVSGEERLRPEGEALVRALEQVGVPTSSTLLEGLWHDVHLQAGTVREATHAVAALGRALRDGG